MERSIRPCSASQGVPGLVFLPQCRVSDIPERDASESEFQCCAGATRGERSPEDAKNSIPVRSGLCVRPKPDRKGRPAKKVKHASCLHQVVMRDVLRDSKNP